MGYGQAIQVGEMADPYSPQEHSLKKHSASLKSASLAFSSFFNSLRDVGV